MDKVSDTQAGDTSAVVIGAQGTYSLRASTPFLSTGSFTSHEVTERAY